MKPVLLFALLALAACDPMTDPTPGGLELPPETVTTDPLPFFGDGYRAPGDQCRRIGENDYTNQFLDHTADFVGCPEDMENLGVFVTETGAVAVARTQGYVLFSVPTG
ncbi:hypothetical protein [Tropicimonas sp. S265A]|uniref:hypothetical protein n=1 Tax=Tropicimonas sp. S265A TaxID=3415134 RepID=UPI003C7B79AF